MAKVDYLLSEIKSINEIETKTILIIDGGHHIDLAELLVSEAYEVLYHVPWYSQEVKIKRPLLGRGIEKVKVVDDLWAVIDTVDLIVFTDVYLHDLMIYLVGKGYNVYGPKEAAPLELNKELSRNACVGVGISMSPAHKVKGLSNLRRDLKGKEHKLVKPVMWRGDCETFEFIDDKASEAEFSKLQLSLGHFAEDFEWMVEDKTEGLELGVDGITMNGQYLDPMLFAWTTGYVFVGKFLPYTEIPNPFHASLEKLKKVFAQYKARSFFATEEIMTKKKGSSFLDITMRFSNVHTSSSFIQGIDNFGEVINSLATNKDLKLTSKYTHAASMSLLVFKAIEDEWATIKAPKDCQEWLKLEHYAKEGNDYLIAPKKQMDIGCIIALGQSWDEVIDLLQERYKKLDSTVYFEPAQAPEKYYDAIKEVKSYGINFD